MKQIKRILLEGESPTLSFIFQVNDIVNDIIKLIALSSVSAGQIKMQENGKCRLLVNKKTQNDQEIHC